MYAHGGVRNIGVTLMLQAPTGAKLSSDSNRVTYFPEKHVILGALIYQSSKEPAMDSRETGAQHPLMSNRNRYDVSPEYRRYCLKVTGCDDKGFFFGQPVRSEKEADEAAQATNDALDTVPEEDRKAATDAAEEALRAKSGLRKECWPPATVREFIETAAKKLVSLGRVAEATALEKKPDVFHFLAMDSPFRALTISRLLRSKKLSELRRS